MDKLHLTKILTTLLEEHSKYEIILALEQITAAQSLERIKLMKHVDKAVDS